MPLNLEAQQGLRKRARALRSAVVAVAAEEVGAAALRGRLLRRPLRLCKRRACSMLPRLRSRELRQENYR
jgi:hypothetical protein